MHVLAHAGGHNSVETLFLLAAAGLAWAAIRVRGVRIFGRPGLASWAVGMLAVTALVLAFVVPARLGTTIAPVRPSTDAQITIVSPRPHQVLHGNPAAIQVRLRLTGAR